MILKALEEDIGQGDVTTEALIAPGHMSKAVMVAKSPLVVAGLGIAGAVFTTLDPRVKLKQLVKEGAFVKPKTKLLSIEGHSQVLLKGERVALNFLQRLSGIATQTKQYVDETKGFHTQILDTRKTTPLFRHLEKFAVKKGGGKNHRMGLYDEILIKDNHIEALKGDVVKAIALARKHPLQVPVVIEVTHLKQLQKILNEPIDRVLLDNMTHAHIKTAVKMVNHRFKIEVSGGVTLKRIRSLCKLGVDYISVGALTHSVKAADISLEFLKS